MVGDDIGGVAGHEQAVQAGEQDAQVVGQKSTVHFGHDHIGHQQLDRAAVLAGKTDGLGRAGRGQNGVAQTLQHGRGNFEDHWLIFHHQDGFAARCCLIRHFLNRRLGAGAVPRQVDLEGRALAGFTIDIDEPLVLFDDAIDRRQPQAGALTHLLGGEEGLEQVGQGGCINAAAVVAHRQQDIGALHSLDMVGAVPLIDGDQIGLDGDLAGIADGVAGVDEQVHQDLVELRRIDVHLAGVASRLPDQIDILADEPPQHLQHPCHGCVDIEHLGSNSLFAGEGQELPGQIGGALGRLANVLQAGMERMRALQPPERQFAMADDDAQHVVEIMGDAAGQPAHGFHLLRLDQLHLQFLPFLFRPFAGADLVEQDRDLARCHLEGMDLESPGNTAVGIADMLGLPGFAISGRPAITLGDVRVAQLREGILADHADIVGCYRHPEAGRRQDWPR